MADLEAIGNFKAFTGVEDDAVAQAFITGASGNAQTAVNHYFDNPDRYVKSDQPYHEPHFNIYSADDIGHTSYDQEMANYTKSGAPTRPPSKESSTRAMDIDLSQETGIIAAQPTSNFGPATRESYEPDQWAMTTALEILPDLDPLERGKSNNELSFIKPLVNADPLPALLTILGQIPLVQTVFLQQLITDDYGSNPDWWSGDIIQTDIELEDPEDFTTAGKLAFLAETQRLIAFLSQSDRLYASAEQLIKFEVIGDARSFEDVAIHQIQLHNYIDRFVVAWTHAIRCIQGSLQCDHLFLTRAINGDETVSFYTMEIRLDPIYKTEAKTLYDAVDNMTWYSNPDGTVFLSQVPPVLVLRIVRNAREARPIDIDIPAELYLDRYMIENEEISLKSQSRMEEVKDQIDNIDLAIRQLARPEYAPTGTVSRSQLLIENTIEYLRTPLRVDNSQEDTTTSTATATATSSSSHIHTSRKTSEEDSHLLANQLEVLLQNLHTQVKNLEDQKKRLQSTLANLGNFLKQPNVANENEAQPTNLYNLRGVCTNHRNVYFQGIREDISDPESLESNWWRYEYTNEPSVIKSPQTINQVLHAAKTDAPEIVLVYAAHAATYPLHQPPTLPQPLEQFIKRDNLAFQKECLEANNNSFMTSFHRQQDDSTMEDVSVDDSNHNNNDNVLRIINRHDNDNSNEWNAINGDDGLDNELQHSSSTQSNNNNQNISNLAFENHPSIPYHPASMHGTQAQKTQGQDTSDDFYHDDNDNDSDHIRPNQSIKPIPQR